MDKLLENFKWFLDNHAELYAKYPNKHIVIVDKKVVASFDISKDAIIFANTNYGNRNYNVQHCTEDNSGWICITNIDLL